MTVAILRHRMPGAWIELANLLVEPISSFFQERALNAMRMLSARETAWFNRDPQSTWDLILQLREWPCWCDGLTRSRWIEGNAWEPGSRFKLEWDHPVDVPLLGGEVIQHLDPTSIPESMREISWGSGRGPFRAESRLLILEDGNGSLVEFVTTWSGWASIFMGHRADRCASLQRDWLASLREALERVGSNG